MIVSEAEIKDRVRALLKAELRRRLEREPLPHLCVHNHRQPLDYRKSVYGEPNAAYNRISVGTDAGVALPVLQTLGLCMLGADSPETWAGTICEEPLDAQRCPYFTHKETREQIYERFKADVQDGAWVEAHLPAAHSLLWVLGGSVKLDKTPVLHWLWSWLSRYFSKGSSEKAVDVLVYLPALDAFSDQDRPRALASN